MAQPVRSDFDALDWEAPDAFKDPAVTEAVQTIIDRVNSNVHASCSYQQSQTDAIDYCLHSCLDALDLLYIKHDATLTAASISGDPGWQLEPEPVPCAPDTYLRSAIPDTLQPVTKQITLEKSLSIKPTTRTLSPAPSTASRPGTAPKPAATDPPAAASLGSSSRLAPQPPAKGKQAAAAQAKQPAVPTTKVKLPAKTLRPPSAGSAQVRSWLTCHKCMHFYRCR